MNLRSSVRGHMFDGDVEQALVEDDEEEKGNAEEQEEETCMEEVD